MDVVQISTIQFIIKILTLVTGNFMGDLKKRTLAGLEMLRVLASEGYRIFTFKDVASSALIAGVDVKYTAEALSHLKRNKWIMSLKRGVYAFTPESGLSYPPNELEIAQSLVITSAISHWTAMHFHHLTQQTPNIVYSIVHRNVSIPRTILKNKYRFIQVRHEYFFGIENVWIEEAKIQITDLERTLLDGLRQPQYCGNFEEVLYAFETGISNGLDLQKIIRYALKLEKVISKRLGYILQKFGVPLEKLKPLLEVSVKGFKLLDPSGPRNGSCNKIWMIVDNI